MPEIVQAPRASESFISPSRNLRCVYGGAADALTCWAEHLGVAVTLDSSGQAVTGSSSSLSADGARVLAYGEAWQRSVFTCESFTRGVQRAANVGSYGGTFFISRDGIAAHSD